MKIAIISGASSGLGIEFYKQIQKEELDEIWIIARREAKLKEISEKYGKIKTRILPFDLSIRENISKIYTILCEEKPNVKFLFNNAGMGIWGDVYDADFISQGNMVDLNVRSLTEMSTVCVKFMSEKSYIINTCSIASFVPNARMSVYSATKAYVMSYTKSLRYELKKKKINVTAICPGPMETEFLAVAGIDKGTSKAFDNLPYCNPEKVAKKGIKSAKRGKCVYTPRGFYKFYRVIAKILPHSLLLGMSKT